jgi:hypothetical protein
LDVDLRLRVAHAAVEPTDLSSKRPEKRVDDKAAQERVRVLLEDHGGEHGAELWRLIELFEPRKSAA